jgi:uncharacterized damage-inducible protein DinB
MTHIANKGPAGDSTGQAGQADPRRLLAAALGFLQQGLDLLDQLEPESYSRPHPAVYEASIGGHYRHGLDHFVSLLRAMESGLVDYDRRDRDPRVEQELETAQSSTRIVRSELQRWDSSVLEREVRVRCSVSDCNPEPPLTRSTLGRELAYAITHGIHHYAMIGVIARLEDLPLPAGFGVAPSTTLHRRALAG